MLNVVMPSVMALLNALELYCFFHFSQYSASSVKIVKYHNDEHLVFIVMLGIVLLNASILSVVALPNLIEPH